MTGRNHLAHRVLTFGFFFSFQALPANIGANLEIRYASETDVAREGLIGILDLNHVVDAVMRIVYEAARNTKSSDTQKRSRRIIFSGFDATVSGLDQLDPFASFFFHSPGFCAQTHIPLKKTIALYSYPTQATKLCSLLQLLLQREPQQWFTARASRDDRGEFECTRSGQVGQESKHAGSRARWSVIGTPPVFFFAPPETRHLC